MTAEKFYYWKRNGWKIEVKFDRIWAADNNLVARWRDIKSSDICDVAQAHTSRADLETADSADPSAFHALINEQRDIKS